MKKIEITPELLIALGFKPVRRPGHKIQSFEYGYGEFKIQMAFRDKQWGDKSWGKEWVITRSGTLAPFNPEGVVNTPEDLSLEILRVGMLHGAKDKEKTMKRQFSDFIDSILV